MAKPPKYKSQLSQDVVTYADIIMEKSMLCLDPSSGSSGSVPGYALFKAGVLVDAGTVALPRGTRSIQNRLYLLRKALEAEFEQPDILNIEKIGIHAGAAKFVHKGTMSLIKSVGTCISVWDCPTIETAPMTWHSLLPKTGYVKTDSHDAVCLGLAALTLLARHQGMPDPVWPEFLFHPEEEANG
jgi:hypothetical protein